LQAVLPLTDKELPQSLSTELLNHQRVGPAKLNFLCRSKLKGAIFCDEMGLGKTIQFITACEISKDEIPGFCDLIVTSKTLINNVACDIREHFRNVSKASLMK